MISALGCAQKSYISVQQIVPPPTWNKITIMPFSGDAKMAEIASSILMNELENKTHMQMVNHQPENPPQHAQDNTLTSSQAQKRALLLNVDAYFQGNVVSQKRGKSFDAFATIDLVETISGRVVASTHRPSGELLATSEEECIVAATERASKDMVKAISHLHIQKPLPKSTEK